MKLNKIRTIKGRIKLITGLHIGASKDNIEIGGLDQPIIKDPLPESGAPYIPGSSLKGKMRSIMEIYKGKANNGKPCQCGNCDICKVFGVSAGATKIGNNSNSIGPTRIIVRDAMLSEDWMTKFKLGNLPMEVKYENSIDRISGTARDPRPLERVPASVEFDYFVSLKEFENDGTEIFETVIEAMSLLELDYLGGCGSRGCGQIEFSEIVIDGNKQPDNFLETKRNQMAKG